MATAAPILEKNYEHRDALVLAHTHVVRIIAVEMSKTYPVSYEDLISEGYLGLLEAAERYDASKSIFAVYAKHRIRGRMMDYLRSLDMASRDLRQVVTRVDRAHQNMIQQRMEHVPMQEVIEEALGSAHLQTKRWVEQPPRMISLGAESSLKDPQPTPLEQLLCKERVFRVRTLLSRLPLRWCYVLQRYYFQSVPMNTIAGTLGVNESRVSHMHRQAMVRLRKMYLGENHALVHTEPLRASRKG